MEPPSDQNRKHSHITSKFSGATYNIIFTRRKVDYNSDLYDYQLVLSFLKFHTKGITYVLCLTFSFWIT